MTKWFRFYADAMRNPKVAALSDRDFRLWVGLLSVASENDGSIPPAETLKRVLSMRLDHLYEGLKRLASSGLIDALATGYEPHNWSKFQYKSDTSTERVKKHRTERNVSVTPPEQKQIQKAATQLGAGSFLYDRLIEAASSRGGCHPNLAMGIGPITDLTAKGYDLDADILPVIREKARPDIASWKFYATIIVERVASKNAIPQKPSAPVEDWSGRIAAWNQDRTWIHAWGPKPGERGCRVPRDLLERIAA